jgi:hypothetical protein
VGIQALEIAVIGPPVRAKLRVLRDHHLDSLLSREAGAAALSYALGAAA